MNLESSRSTTEAVKHVASQLGFADCRIAAASGPVREGQRFLDWVASGQHGDMEWMAANPKRRTDPRLVLPGVQAVVCVALNYFTRSPVGSPAAEGARGRIARYAWGDDYHGTMDAKLRDLAAFLEEHGGTQRLYVDTGPVLERSWASAAGLGWNGKSTVQIHRRFGAWTFLGEILTTLPLLPDTPAKDHCGSCSRCMAACPTGAITGPHQMDARRCISYLTIEHKGTIPVKLRRAMADRIYGCDECLEVCPWNRFAQESREAAFAARAFVSKWKLRDFLGLDDAAFRELFRWSPVKRIKLSAFLRNVCVALGNVGQSTDLPALEKIADGQDAVVAEHARWAMDEIRLRSIRLRSIDVGA